MWIVPQQKRAESVMPLSQPASTLRGWAALGLPETGWLLITDQDQCQLCPDVALQPCQLDCRRYQATCTFCADRILAGSLPFCVENCPHGAIWVGNLDRNTATNGIRVIPLTELLKRRRFDVSEPDCRTVVLHS